MLHLGCPVIALSVLLKALDLYNVERGKKIMLEDMVIGFFKTGHIQTNIFQKDIKRGLEKRKSG